MTLSVSSDSGPSSPQGKGEQFMALLHRAGYDRSDVVCMDAQPVFQPDATLVEQDVALEVAQSEDQPMVCQADRLYFKHGEMLLAHPLMTLYELQRMEDRVLKGRLADGYRQRLTPLPNTGSAMYYSKKFKMNRFKSPFYKYSALAQSHVLHTYDAFHQKFPHKGYDAVVQQAFDSLVYPYEEGGVALGNHRVLMEFPSYGGVPEIILNGWLDALLLLQQYAARTQDAKAIDLYQSNIVMLSQLLPLYDVPSLGLSRYSDVTPYRMVLEHSAGAAELEEPLEGAVLYEPRLPGFPALLYGVPVGGKDAPYGPYDNHWVSIRPEKAMVCLGLSRLYKATLIVNRPNAKLSFDPGQYSERKATPDKSGERIEVKGRSREGITVFRIPPGSVDITCGFPTNFLKANQTNHYHVFHIVALLGLALDNTIPPPIAERLKLWAVTWYETLQTRQDDFEGQFADPKDMWHRMGSLYVPAFRQQSFDTVLQAAIDDCSGKAASAKRAGPSMLS